MDQSNTINMVKKGTRKVIPGGFTRGFRSLPYSAARGARKKITEDCSWSRGLFDKKERGQTPFTNLEIRYLEEFFQQFSLNAWTGEIINKN